MGRELFHENADMILDMYNDTDEVDTRQACKQSFKELVGYYDGQFKLPERMPATNGEWSGSQGNPYNWEDEGV
jgi:hypothetical protein